MPGSLLNILCTYKKKYNYQLKDGFHLIVFLIHAILSNEDDMNRLQNSFIYIYIYIYIII